MLEKQPVTLCYNFDIFADDIEELVSSTVSSNESAVMITEQSVIVIEDEPVVTAQDIFHGMSDQFADALLNGTALDPLGMLSESESDNPFDDHESSESEATSVPSSAVDGRIEDIREVHAEAEAFWDSESVGTDRPDINLTC